MNYLNQKGNISLGIIFVLLSNLGAVFHAYAGELTLPKPGTMVHLSPAFNPPILKGIKVYPEDPLRFDFILDRGTDKSEAQSSQLKAEAQKLIKYFLASLTIPEKDLWVNLSPHEKDRVVPEAFGQTEMGRDLLAQDYMLKQITASLIYPENEIGKRFWKRVYEEAAREFGTTNIPVNTFNKVWIVPEKAVVYENVPTSRQSRESGSRPTEGSVGTCTAYVVESKLKVMLEQDYLALEKNELSPTLSLTKRGGQSDSPSLFSKRGLGAVAADIVREIIIPQLTTEINQGQNFAQLRQAYNSLILATWYKKKIKDSILSQVYKDKRRIKGVDIATHNLPLTSRRIYELYLQAFKKGAYNYIKEEQDPLTKQLIPRKYFSGGWVGRLNIDYSDHVDQAQLGGDTLLRAQLISVPAVALNKKDRLNLNKRLRIQLLQAMKDLEIVGELGRRYRFQYNAAGSKKAQRKGEDGPIRFDISWVNEPGGVVEFHKNVGILVLSHLAPRPLDRGISVRLDHIHLFADSQEIKNKFKAGLPEQIILDEAMAATTDIEEFLGDHDSPGKDVDFLKFLHNLRVLGSDGQTYRFWYSRSSDGEVDTFGIGKMGEGGSTTRVGVMNISPQEGASYFSNGNLFFVVEGIHLSKDNRRNGIFSGFLKALPGGTQLRLKTVINTPRGPLWRGLLEKGGFSPPEIVSSGLTVDILSHKDKAGLAEKGGIDFSAEGGSASGGNSHKIDRIFEIKDDSRQMGMPPTGTGNGGVPLFVDPAMLARLRKAAGFEPVIVGMQTMTDVRGFLAGTN